MNPKLVKELTLCLKLKYSNSYIFKTWWYKPLIFWTQVIWFNRMHSLKYPRSTTFGSKDYSDLKIRVCGKDLIPLWVFQFLELWNMACWYLCDFLYNNAKLQFIRFWTQKKYIFLIIKSVKWESLLQDDG